MTGPGPLEGVANSPERATHPTLGLGAKLGGAVCALAGHEAAPPMARTPASMGPLRSFMNFVPTPDITSSPLFGMMGDHTPPTAVPTTRAGTVGIHVAPAAA